MKKVSLWDGATNFQRAALFLLNREGTEQLHDSVEEGRKQSKKGKGENHGDKNSRSFNEKRNKNLWIRDCQ